MTGFGRGQAALDGGRVSIELRTLNHRYQDIRLHLPPELTGLEGEIDKRLRNQFTRGRIELSAHLHGRALGKVKLDQELAKSALTQLEELRVEMGLKESVSVSMLAAIPHVFQQDSSVDHEGAQKAVVEALLQAIDGAEAMRRREAVTLKADFDQRLTTIDGIITELEGLAQEVAPRILKRLRGKIERLLDGETRQLDEARLAQEAAILADRADVSEELTRLRSHVDQFRKISAEGDPVGRRLDFLLQEMARESSTIGAKAGAADIQHKIVDLRGELARMREQVQNIE